MNNLSENTRKQVIEVLGSVNAKRVFDLVTKAPTHFIGIREYVSGTSNKKCITPTIANVTCQLGSMAKKANLDLVTLDAISSEDVMKGANVDQKTAVIALAEVKKSLENKVLGDASNDVQYQRQRQGQLNAYLDLGNGFRLHIGEGESKGEIHFSAFEVGKNVLQKGEFLPTNSRAKTIAKNWITRGLKTSKFRTYRIKLIDQISLQGEAIAV